MNLVAEAFLYVITLLVDHRLLRGNGSCMRTFALSIGLHVVLLVWPFAGNSYPSRHKVRDTLLGVGFRVL